VKLPNKVAAAQVAKESPPTDGKWVWPIAGIMNHLNRNNWPTKVEEYEHEHEESVDPSGIHRPKRQQIGTAIVVPESWLRRFAELVERPLSELIRE